MYTLACIHKASVRSHVQGSSKWCHLQMGDEKSCQNRTKLPMTGSIWAARLAKRASTHPHACIYTETWISGKQSHSLLISPLPKRPVLQERDAVLSRRTWLPALMMALKLDIHWLQYQDSTPEHHQSSLVQTFRCRTFNRNQAKSQKVGLHLRLAPLGIAAVDDVLSRATLVGGIKDKTTRQSSG